MSLAVFRKTLRDAFPLLTILVVATVIFEILFVTFEREVLQDVLTQFASFFFQNEPMRRFVSALLGGDLASDLTSTSLMTVGFSHPIMYTFMWVLIISLVTRTTVGEIDRGTADLLLTLPVSRAAVYVTVTTVWVAGAILVSAATITGAWLGEVLSPLKEPLHLSRLALLVYNLLALNLAVGGLTMLISSHLSRRGPAVACMLTVLLIGLLIQFLDPFWHPARRVNFLSLLHYYRPLAVVRSGIWPTGDLLALTGTAVVAWLLGLWRFTRRDIPAV